MGKEVQFMGKELSEIEMAAEAPNYMKAQRISIALIGIAGIIPRQEKEQYGIPEFIEQRSLRNALARESLSETQNKDCEYLEAARRISNWLIESI